jgi:hypothetical protein
MMGRRGWILNHQNMSIEREHVREADRLSSKSQPQLAKARRDRDSVHWWARATRAGIVAWCVGLALLVGGCDYTTDSRYFRYGIGTDLYSEDIVQTTQFQDIYLNELCRQALPVISTSETACLNGVPGSSGWNMIVQAGLNDVDRRCDSYLAWLDDRRRTNSAVLKELGDITVATQAIMRVSGVSANPITLAGLAFGLAANTFTNINSRLLLEVDKTTVQTLVLRRRNDYRLQLQRIRVESRPAAVHALRSYLNICTPFTIETDINSTITVFQVGGSAALDRQPLVNAETVRGTIVERAHDPMPERKFPKGPSVAAAFITNVQLALCVPTVDGVAGGSTLSAVRDYLQAIPKPVPTPIDPTSTALRSVLQKAITEVRDCNAQGFKSAFEVGRYGVAEIGIKMAITKLQQRIATFLAGKTTTVIVKATGTFDQQTRDGIKEIRRLDGTTGGDVIDRPLAEILAGT